VTRNADYWKQGRPYLDGIEYTIIRNLSTQHWRSFPQLDMTFPYTHGAALKDVKARCLTQS